MDIEALIYRILAGEATEEERDEVKKWLAENEEHRALYRDIERTWYKCEYAGYWQEETEATWMTLKTKHQSRQYKKWLWRGGSVAAAVLLLLGMSILLLDDKEEEKTIVAQVKQAPDSGTVLLLSTGEKIILEEKTDTIWVNGTDIQTKGRTVSRGQQAKAANSGELVYNELIVPIGGANRLYLPDGTMVYLNASSRLKFPIQFTGEKREVILEGEGYFEVAPDTHKPFVVHTPTVDVKVLGTCFNIMAYATDPRTEVTLVSGKVDVNTGVYREVLQPAQQFVLDNASQQHEVKEVDVSTYIGWKEGVLNFKAMPLEELCKRLGRWYNIGFQFTREDMKHLKFTGAVRKDYDIGYILTMLEAMTDVTFKQEGDQVIVNKK